ncbi:MAG TPA: TIM barrel protein [Candidatus Hydrogenedentes bacterium]|nr:TIM barrel protein [Candidatus Hydrogenedentota bacterium]HNT87295.1 TIM barrel protein [Candidatus Hydrogenedentota bacterium]
MYVSIRDCLLAETFPTLAEGLRELDVESVEIELTRDFKVAAFDAKGRVRLATDEDAEAYGRQLRALGVHPCSFLTARDFSVGEPGDNVAWVARAMELAAILGMTNIRIDSAMSRERELDFETRVNLFAAGLGGALARTGGLTVALAIENHGFQGNNLAFLLNVFHRVGSNRIGATLDTGNFYWRGYPLSEVYGILRLLAPYAKHTHLKNIRYPEEVRETVREAGWEYGKYVCPLDEGDIDHERVVGMLRDAGYEGDLCIEDESLGKCATPEERAAVLHRDVAHVRAIRDRLT